jgi:hypothetical protein
LAERNSLGGRKLRLALKCDLDFSDGHVGVSAFVGEVERETILVYIARKGYGLGCDFAKMLTAKHLSF